MRKRACPRRRSRRRSNLRRILPGVTYLITKKINDDRFLIRPSLEINQILLYVLILKANKHGILVHGFCFMSNHFHLIVTDLRGRLPAFMGEFLTETSKAIQVQLSDNRRIWSGQRYSDVTLLDLDAAERELAYTVLNPTRAGLTNPGDWPGLTSVRWKHGEAVVEKRPGVYFSKRCRPEQVSLQLAPLAPVFLELTPTDTELANEESRVRIQEHIDSAVESIHRDLDRRGKSLAGSARVLGTSRERRGSHPVRHLRPRFATKNLALMLWAIGARKRFEAAHEKARRRYIGGRPRTVFPPGTYGYRQLLQVRVEKESVAA